jgi:hypothetical protein
MFVDVLEALFLDRHHHFWLVRVKDKVKKSPSCPTQHFDHEYRTKYRVKDRKITIAIGDLINKMLVIDRGDCSKELIDRYADHYHREEFPLSLNVL